MVQVWNNYLTDLGRAYPMYALAVSQINDVDSSFNPLDLLPPGVLTNLIKVKNSCPVTLLTPRSLLLFATDGGQFRINYPVPFDRTLFDFLTLNTDVQAFEFVGERIKYGRLWRMLENV